MLGFVEGKISHLQAVGHFCDHGLFGEQESARDSGLLELFFSFSLAWFECRWQMERKAKTGRKKKIKEKRPTNFKVEKRFFLLLLKKRQCQRSLSFFFFFSENSQGKKREKVSQVAIKSRGKKELFRQIRKIPNLPKHEEQGKRNGQRRIWKRDVEQKKRRSVLKGG